NTITYKENKIEIKINNRLEYDFDYYILLLLNVEKYEMEENDILFYRNIVDNEEFDVFERGLMYLILLEKGIKYKNIELLNKLRIKITEINLMSKKYIVDEVKEIILEIIGEKIRMFIEKDIEKEIEEYKNYKIEENIIPKKEDGLKSFISNFTSKFQINESDTFDL
ncbi:hypothetical protein SLOPH_1137, partial [Spraguea lophii 42_110]